MGFFGAPIAEDACKLFQWRSHMPAPQEPRGQCPTVFVNPGVPPIGFATVLLSVSHDRLLGAMYGLEHCFCKNAPPGHGPPTCRDSGPGGDEVDPAIPGWPAASRFNIHTGPRVRRIAEARAQAHAQAPAGRTCPMRLLNAHAHVHAQGPGPRCEAGNPGPAGSKEAQLLSGNRPMPMPMPKPMPMVQGNRR